MTVNFYDTTLSGDAAESREMTRRVVDILGRYAPQHQFRIGGGGSARADVYHTLTQYIPYSVRHRGASSVVTVPNLNFVRYPHIYSLPERMFVLPLYRHCCRVADRIITVSESSKRELSERLNIDSRKIEVVMPLVGLTKPVSGYEIERAAVREKYDLPEDYILMLGTVEPRHNHSTLLQVLDQLDEPYNLVICGRHTTYSDVLLRFAREHHLVSKITFVYELLASDLPTIFAMARSMVYTPHIETSILPVIEAMRLRVPMILSDTVLNREAAADAALYVTPGSAEQMLDALLRIMDDEEFRRRMVDREAERAELFSEFAVAQRLVEIYSAL